ncbi:MAG: hypothetical protein JW804_08390 [Sedimentisphaerales bacterium]|nr:hypothetical protein [Sedimentisphaerales bacterium]
MPKKELSNYQKNVVSGYYANLDNIMLSKLSELVTELYLASSDNKRKKQWARVEKAMNNLKIPPTIKAHILEKQDVRILAKNLNDWQKK